MDEFAEFAGTGIVLLVLGTYWLIRRHHSEALRAKRINRKLHGTARWLIGELPEDTFGRIVGRVRAADKLLTAPISGRRCVCYTVVVEQDENDGKAPVVKATHINERKAVPFVIEDDTGRAIVDGGHVQLALVLDHESKTGSDRPTNPQHDRLLARHGVTVTWLLGTRRLEFSEGVIEIGDRVAVLGGRIRVPDRDVPSIEAPYRAPEITAFQLSGSRRRPLLISNYPDEIGEDTTETA